MNKAILDIPDYITLSAAREKIRSVLKEAAWKTDHLGKDIFPNYASLRAAYTSLDGFLEFESERVK